MLHRHLERLQRHPLLEQLEIARAGLHAFRHSRVTVLRKRGTPGDLQRKWVGHSSLTTTDRYSHTDEELEYRREAAEKAGIGLWDPIAVIGPNESGKGRTV
jgi:integrase